MEAIVGLVIGRIPILLCPQNRKRERSGEREKLRREREVRDWPVGGVVRAHTFINYLHHLIRAQFVAPQNNYIVTPKVTDQRSP